MEYRASLAPVFPSPMRHPEVAVAYTHTHVFVFDRV